MAKQSGSTVLRTSLAAALIGLGLVAAVMEVRADLTPSNTQRRRSASGSTPCGRRTW